MERVIRRWKRQQAAASTDTAGSKSAEEVRLALSDDNEDAIALLDWVEDCLFHGLKVC